MNRTERVRLIAAAAALAGSLAVVAIAVVVLDAAFSDDPGPRVTDHWHAAYRVVVCGEPQPPIEEFSHSSGIHSHTDGIMHLHPLTAEGEGSGASVESFFSYSGGWFDVLRVRDGCVTQDPTVLRADSGIHPLGSGFAEANAICDELSTAAFEEVGRDYIPRDGDCLRIIFGETES